METFNAEGFAEFSPGNGVVDRDGADKALVPEPAKIDEVKKELWIQQNVACGNSEMLMRTLAEGVTRIGYDEFQEAATETAKSVSETVGDEPYVIVADEEGKSFWWVLNIMHENLPKNFTLVQMDQLKQFSVDHPEVKNIVYLDDAGYSVTQAEINLGQVKGLYSDYVDNGGPIVEKLRSDVKIIVAIPYLTSFAEKKLQSKTDHNLKVFGSRKIESVREHIVSKLGDLAGRCIAEADKIYREHLRFGDDTWDRITTTFLDHKRPDQHSFFAPIANGLIIGPEGDTVTDGTGEPVQSEFVPDISGDRVVYHGKGIKEVCPWLKEEDCKYISI